VIAEAPALIVARLLESAPEPALLTI